jgi:hypothetical protein
MKLEMKAEGFVGERIMQCPWDRTYACELRLKLLSVLGRSEFSANVKSDGDIRWSG